MQPPYSHYMDPASYEFTNNFGKMLLLVALLLHLLATGGDGQTCYTWYRWLQPVLPRYQKDGLG